MTKTDKYWIVSILSEYVGYGYDHSDVPIRVLSYDDVMWEYDGKVDDALGSFLDSDDWKTRNINQNDSRYNGKIIGIRKCELTNSMIESIKKFK